MMETAVTVTFGRKLLVDDQVSSYDTALDNAADIIEAVIKPDALNLRSSHTFFDRMTTATTPSGEWLIVTLRFACIHLLNLSS